MQKPMRSLIRTNPKQGIVINLMLLVALASLIIGVTSPLLTLEKLYFFENTVTLFTTVTGLFSQKEWFLFFVIAIFSLCIPVIKIASLMLILNLEYKKGSFLGKALHVIETLGKWSMLDVFVVALLLVSVKLGVLAKVEVHYGLYIFAASVLLTMGLSFWIYHLAEKRSKNT
jgi:paraquat-inducible protein A